MDYISREALIDEIQGTASEVCMKAPYDAEWFTRMQDRQFEIIATIERFPAADVREVKRGQWKQYRECCLEVQCSNCEAGHCREDNFCPTCGADMRGGQDNG